MPADLIIELSGVKKAFGSKVVLDGIDLEVRKGDRLALLGPSGCGKSVTLKHINGLIRPDSGSVRVLGFEVSEMEESELIPLRRRVSYLFQGGALFDSMTVFENVAFPLVEHLGLEGEELVGRVKELLSMVRLEGVEPLMPSELSGGMRKRVALARALALEPEVILYDEPTTGLDPLTSRAIADLIMELQQRFKNTTVVVTHDMQLVRRVASRIAFLEEGKLVFEGPLSRAMEEAPEKVRLFLSGGWDE